MADGTAGGGGGSPPDIFWNFPGQLAGDQNVNLFTYQAERALSFIGFSAKLNIAPTGTPISIQWLKNGIIVFTLTVAVGSTFQFSAFAVSLVAGDTLQPQINGVGSIAPGTTMLMKARGS